MTHQATMPNGLKQQTAKAFAWSALQSWSVKLLSLVLFFVLARYLSPTEMGMAQSVMLLLTFTILVAGQGLHIALIQQKDLHRDDVNLPFMVSVAFALLASAAMAWFADAWAVALGKPDIAGLIRIAAIAPPFVATNGILVAMLNRAMNFRTIATSTLIASLLSGAAALTLAVNGYGALSLVVQAVISAVVLALLVWRKTLWLPTWRVKTDKFRNLVAFGVPAFATNLVEFFSSRLIEFIILARYGLIALGIYAVGAKLYQAVLELITHAVTQVAFSALSRIASDEVRLRTAYLRLIFLASCTLLPALTLLSALAPEICLILFGAKWAGADLVLSWLALLGAIHVVQQFNVAVLASAGNSTRNLLVGLVQLAAGAAALTLYPAHSMGELARAFVFAQVLVVPVSFAGAMKATGADAKLILRHLLPGLLAAAVALGAVMMARGFVNAELPHALMRVAVLGTVFVAVYVAAIKVAAGPRLASELRYAAESFPALDRLLGSKRK